ncbi:lantibiotic modifying enzyme [Pedobacter sp. AK017]|uniref:lanthionine synthetase C family protein n=1 Tax=Pedobacter sp. AK017 TaxID=2723073 RepID=UPI00161BEC3E|nr:lanthionine synthetase C family protein [Pedobacter sp. AK017]MBB5441360.1 lantibiotic modifying enzyme [Pedobacter sp. AK017]
MLEDKIKARLDEIAATLTPFADAKDIGLGLFTGKLGLSLFLAYYAQFKKSEADMDNAVQIVEHMFDQTSFNAEYYNLSTGFSGLDWLLEHYNHTGILEVNTDEVFAGHDQELYERMMAELARYHYDYISGGLGIFMYFLAKAQTEQTRAWLANGMDLLEKMSVSKNGLVSWYDYDIQNANVNFERKNLGLSHGIPGILAVLVRAYAKDVSRKKTMMLIRRTADYLLSLYDENSSGISIFAHYDIAGKAPELNSRLAWCYGDLGICLALTQANTVLKDDKIEGLIRRSLSHAVKRRDSTETLVHDSALCHGAAGAAHIFHHFYRRYLNPDLKAAAEYWYQVSLDEYAFKDGAESFQRDANLPTYANSIGFLEGISGIGLAYISYLKPELSGWDEILLIS